MEPYSFIIISDSSKQQQIIDETVQHGPTRRFMEESPLWIMICVDFARQLKLFELIGVKTKLGEASKILLGVIDADLAAENMVLAAETLGLGTCFVGSVWTAPKKIAEILNLSKNVLPLLLLCVGCPDETPPLRPRWPLEAILYENNYELPNNCSQL